jgi:hypothetical protein
MTRDPGAQRFDIIDFYDPKSPRHAEALRVGIESYRAEVRRERAMLDEEARPPAELGPDEWLQRAAKNRALAIKFKTHEDWRSWYETCETACLQNAFDAVIDKQRF